MGDDVTTATQMFTEMLRESSSRSQGVLRDIGDEEFFWEPCGGCWTVHRRSEKRARHADGAGEWVIDYVAPDPTPAPVTTIAWRVVHLASVNFMYWEYAFGAAKAKFPKLELPGNAREAVQWLDQTQQKLLEVLGTLDDEELDVPRRTNWGQKWPTRQLFKTLLDEQIHHGAEIALLRDLYRNRSTLRREEVEQDERAGHAQAAVGDKSRSAAKATRQATGRKARG
jgi:hypothetical protein